MIVRINSPMSFLHFDLSLLIKTGGYLVVFGFVFAESGLLIGFFLPGDSLLFTAGFLASQGFLHIWALVLGACFFAILGDSVGYAFGRRVGPRLFIREESWLFKPSHLIKAKAFYEKHGKKTIILARFMPIVRTFAPIVAGIGEMHYGTFISYNVIGGVAWGAGLSLLGYFLGNAIPDVDKYLLPIIAGIIVISILPPIIGYLRERKKTL